MYLSEYITLNIKGPIKLIIVSFYKEDEAILKFLRYFRNSLQNKDIIVAEKKFNTINQLIEFFRDIRKEYSYNSLMLVTHGRKEEGNPTFEETKVEPGPHDEIVESWIFLSFALHDAGIDCLGFLAICYSGNYHVFNLLTHGQPQFLHIVAPSPGKPLGVEKGAKAIALFIDILAEMHRYEYTEKDLKSAEEKVNKQYPGIIKLWLY